MDDIYISERAYPEVTAYLKSAGNRVHTVPADKRLGLYTGDHADLRVIRLGESVIFADEDDFKPDYPENAAFCALAFGKYFVHRLNITAPALLNEARQRGMELIDVRQGYARCSALPVDGRSVITADRGIARALRERGADVLEISPGHVLLPGYAEGFFGGCGGRVGDTVVFNGDLRTHPDCERIVTFIAERGIGVKFFPDLVLRDIGSIVS